MNDLILLISTAQLDAEVLLLKGQKIVASKKWPATRELGRELLKVIDALLNEHGYTLSHVDRIAVHRGPGGYSSLRAGVMTAITLAYAQQIELVEVAGTTPEENITQALAAAPVNSVTPQYQ